MARRILVLSGVRRRRAPAGGPGGRAGPARARARRRREERRRADAHQRRLPQALRHGLPRPGQPAPRTSWATSTTCWTARAAPTPSATGCGWRSRSSTSGRSCDDDRGAARGTWSSTPTSSRPRSSPACGGTGRCDLPQITVTTDFETHRLWVNQPCDAYTTATDEGAAYLRHWGVPADHVHVTGIPIHPVFSQAERPRRLPAKPRAWPATGPIVLQLAGGFGVGPIEKLFRGVLARRDAAGGGRRRREERRGEGAARGSRPSRRGTGRR